MKEGGTYILSLAVLCIVLVAGLWLAVAETLPTEKACKSVSG